MNKKQYDEYRNILFNYYPDIGLSSIRKEKLISSREHQRMLDIIVPAYNMELYVDKCIQSILKQKTKYSFRVIIIDDGSTDSTGTRIDRYRDNKNVLVIHQKNGGLSAARNVGIIHSNAKYVMFVDSDDLLPPAAVELLITAAESENADIAAGSYCNFRKSRWLRKVYWQVPGLIKYDSDLTGHACEKVLRRELFEDVQFPEKYWFEDSIMHQIIYPKAKKKVGIKNVVYERRVNRNSITHSSAGNPKSIDSVWVTLRLMEDREKLGLQRTQEYYEYLLDQIALTHRRLSMLEEEIQKAAFYVMSYRMNELFQDVSTENMSKRLVEKGIKEENFDMFLNGIQ